MSRGLARVIGILLLVAGGFLLYVGWYERYPAEWRDQAGYFINMMSSLTAACFGIPIAYFVLQHFFLAQEDAARRRDVARLARDTLIRAREAVYEGCGLFQAFSERSDLDRLLNDMARLKAYAALAAEGDFDRLTMRSSVRLVRRLSRVQFEVEAAVERLKDFEFARPYRLDIASARVNLANASELMKGELRNRLLADGSDPIPPTLIQRVDEVDFDELLADRLQTLNIRHRLGFRQLLMAFRIGGFDKPGLDWRSYRPLQETANGHTRSTTFVYGELLQKLELMFEKEYSDVLDGLRSYLAVSDALTMEAKRFDEILRRGIV